MKVRHPIVKLCGQMQARCMPDGRQMWARCRPDAGRMQARCRPDAGHMHTLGIHRDREQQVRCRRQMHARCKTDASQMHIKDEYTITGSCKPDAGQTQARCGSGARSWLSFYSKPWGAAQATGAKTEWRRKARREKNRMQKRARTRVRFFFLFCSLSSLLISASPPLLPAAPLFPAPLLPLLPALPSCSAGARS